MCNLEVLSRKLAYLLRHDCDYGYEHGGWRVVSDLIENHSFTQDELEKVVLSDSKGRFELNEDKTRVRALYGHSVQLGLLLTEAEPPEFLYHGTASKYLSSIENCGLLPKSRQYVHLTENIETAVKTGMRHGEPLLLRVASQRMASDGYSFYERNNGLWLTHHVPVNFLEIVSV